MSNETYIDHFYKYKDGKLVYQHNNSIYCSKCRLLRYMGYTYPHDGRLCHCEGQDKIPVYTTI